jgi:hypothetical protein
MGILEMRALELEEKNETNPLLLVIGSFHRVNHGEEEPLADELELTCG